MYFVQNVSESRFQARIWAVWKIAEKVAISLAAGRDRDRGRLRRRAPAARRARVAPACFEKSVYEGAGPRILFANATSQQPRRALLPQIEAASPAARCKLHAL